MRTYGVYQKFWFVAIIWLHRMSHQIRFSFRKWPIFLSYVRNMFWALLSYISTMSRPYPMPGGGDELIPLFFNQFSNTLPNKRCKKIHNCFFFIYVIKNDGFWIRLLQRVRLLHECWKVGTARLIVHLPNTVSRVYWAIKTCNSRKKSSLEGEMSTEFCQPFISCFRLYYHSLSLYLYPMVLILEGSSTRVVYLWGKTGIFSPVQFIEYIPENKTKQITI